MIKKAWFALGCFWGAEYYFTKLKGVENTSVGYMGGKTENPSYKDVCTQITGHYETIEVEYNSEKISYEKLVRYFFEIHDFTQTDGQGPDIGPQYQSVIFWSDPKEKEIAEKQIDILKSMDYKVATKLLQAERFWPAEEYHQDYYEHKGTEPYCHKYHKIF
ncbi:peptide-methionine (S)-S-oxide reductase MsrA [Coprobacter tertius]|uniref:Peptide methionine sulfoxide reductase MsrA n=1 Tax=Coprobacter tertius TaxID=2944915 RepID=A0ABT1ME33_9BACT|nr:peptide-methionine (S)-S-oxide reductase MsrA [Coprobacter tertius]MCP9610893.1 peptide-methionine (S)-S-oxide reductase MsrA [Coprobacter tertius]